MNRSIAMNRVGMFATCLVALAVVGMSCGTANAVLLTQWTYEPEPFTDATGANTTVGPAAPASTGTGTTTGLHAMQLTDWTTPAVTDRRIRTV